MAMKRSSGLWVALQADSKVVCAVVCLCVCVCVCMCVCVCVCHSYFLMKLVLHWKLICKAQKSIFVFSSKLVAKRSGASIRKDGPVGRYACDESYQLTVHCVAAVGV